MGKKAVGSKGSEMREVQRAVGTLSSLLGIRLQMIPRDGGTGVRRRGGKKERLVRCVLEGSDGSPLWSLAGEDGGFDDERFQQVASLVAQMASLDRRIAALREQCIELNDSTWIVHDFATHLHPRQADAELRPVPELLEAILRSVMAVFSADAGIARVRTSGNGSCLAYIGEPFTKSRVEKLLSEGGEVLSGVERESRATVILGPSGSSKNHRAWREFLRERSLHSVAVLPLTVAENGAIGTLAVFSRTSPWHFDNPEKMRLATLLGTVGAGVIASRILAEKQLESKQLQKTAALGLMASALVHELSQPLTVVLAAAQNVLMPAERGKGVSPKKMLEKFAVIEDQVNRMTELKDNLLRFARKAKTKREEVDLVECVHSALGFLRSQLKNRNIALRTCLRKVPSISANYVDLQQVVLNLLLNARDAMADSAEKVLRVSTSRRKSGVGVTVTDTGSGIPSDDLDRVFNPFFTTKGVGMGTGLGLAVSQGIVEQHGGSISVESEVGKGSKFTVTLPINQEGHA